MEGFPADYVGPDYAAGMELVTEHLIALGHKTIAFIGGVRRIAPLAERMAGFHRALRRHKLKSGPVVPCAVIDRASGYAAARELLAKGDVPSAMVCYNDVVALGVMLALNEHGLVPGRDVAVVGCDDVDEAGLHRPALTTFTTDPVSWGARPRGCCCVASPIRSARARRSSFRPVSSSASPAARGRLPNARQEARDDLRLPVRRRLQRLARIAARRVADDPPLRPRHDPRPRRRGSLRPWQDAGAAAGALARGRLCGGDPQHPFLVQIFLIFFGLPRAGIRLDANEAALLAMVINAGAYCTEIVRAGIETIHKGQIEAGLALGLKPLQIFKNIVLFPALKAIYPALTSQFILLMLTSSVVSAISAEELTAVANNLQSQTFRSFEIYIVVTGMYFAMSLMFAGTFALIYRAVFARTDAAR